MAIKPPTQTPPLTGSQTGGRGDPISNLAQILTLAPGSSLTRSIEQIAPATPAEREFLLNQTMKAMLDLGRAPANRAATHNRFNVLLEQQQLLNSPLLQLARLRIAPQQVLVTYTDKPLQVGQSVTLQMTADNRLILRDLINPSATGSRPAPGPLNPAGMTAETRPAGQAALYTAISSAGAPNAREAATGTPTPAEANRELLASTLRLLLPQQDRPGLMTAIGHLRSLPSGVRNEVFSPGVNQALDNLLRQVRSPEQLSNPTQLKQALQGSGVFFENALNNLRNATTKKPGGGIEGRDRPAAQDIKGALLHLLHRVRQELPPASQGAHTNTTVTSPHPGTLRSAAENPALRPAPTLDLLQLLLHLPGKPKVELSDRVLRAQLMMLMQQHTLASLAKVQLQQLHTVNHQQAQADSPQPTQSWSFELPVRLGQEARALEFKIDEEKYEEQSNEGDTQQKRRWTVTLNFDLAETGAFYAQIKVVGKQVAARLWAERETTLEIARTRLLELRKKLQNQGLEVTDLQCLSGAPPNKTIALNYALVDIKT